MARRFSRGVDEVADWRARLAAGAQEMGLCLDARALDAFLAYARLLQKWGERINLTSRLEPEEIISRHLLDSLALLAARPPAGGASLVDIGAGAGLPGLPLKIARPDLGLVLIEPGLRRSTFLRAAADELGLAGVTVLRRRAGGEGPGERLHDWALSRAVAPVDRLLAMAAGLVRPGGLLAAWKGPEEGAASPLAGWREEGAALVAVPGRPTPRAILFFRRG